MDEYELIQFQLKAQEKALMSILNNINDRLNILEDRFNEIERKTNTLL